MKAVPPHVQLRSVSSAILSRLVYAAAELDLASVVAAGNRDVEAISRATGTNQAAMGRFVRALCAFGVLAEDDELISLTPISEALLPDHPNTQRDWILMTGDEWNYRSFGNLVESLRTGSPVVAHTMGASIFSYLDSHAASGRRFRNAMSEGSRQIGPLVARAYDFSNTSSVTDVGGGEGYLLAAILEHHIHLTGTVVEVASVVPHAARVLRDRGLVDRADVVTGNAFDSVPGRSDVIIMKQIIHDWSDEQAMEILRNCRSGLATNGRVLVIDMVVPEQDPAPSFVTADIVMLVLTGGRERTEAEFRSLFADAGLALRQVIDMGTPLSILEAEAG